MDRIVGHDHGPSAPDAINSDAVSILSRWRSGCSEVDHVVGNQYRRGQRLAKINPDAASPADCSRMRAPDGRIGGHGVPVVGDAGTESGGRRPGHRPVEAKIETVRSPVVRKVGMRRVKLSAFVEVHEFVLPHHEEGIRGADAELPPDVHSVESEVTEDVVLHGQVVDVVHAYRGRTADERTVADAAGAVCIRARHGIAAAEEGRIGIQLEAIHRDEVGRHIQHVAKGHVVRRRVKHRLGAAHAGARDAGIGAAQIQRLVDGDEAVVAACGDIDRAVRRDLADRRRDGRKGVATDGVGRAARAAGKVYRRSNGQPRVVVIHIHRRRAGEDELSHHAGHRAGAIADDHHVGTHLGGQDRIQVQRGARRTGEVRPIEAPLVGERSITRGRDGKCGGDAAGVRAALWLRGNRRQGRRRRPRSHRQPKKKRELPQHPVFQPGGSENNCHSECLLILHGAALIDRHCMAWVQRNICS